MNDRLLEVCEREFTNHVEKLFENAPRIPGTGALAETPIIGGVFIRWAVPSFLYERVVAALVARERFRQEYAPAWPELPLHDKAIEAMVDDDNPRHELVGLYGQSLALELWDYELHPRFNTFCSGLMLCKHTPDRIRNDRELQQEFPPYKLEGINGWLSWRSPANRALDRRVRAIGKRLGVSY